MIVPSLQPLLATSRHTRCRSVEDQAAINYDRLPHWVLSAPVHRDRTGQNPPFAASFFHAIEIAPTDHRIAHHALGTFGMHASGSWRDERASNVLDGGAHFYDVYATSDGKYVSIGSIEPQFYTLLLEKLGLAGESLPDQMDRSGWGVLSERFAEIFKTKTRDQWCAFMEGTDICFAPVLSIAEAPEHRHAKARHAYVDVGGVRQPAPAPRFSRTPGCARPAPSVPGADSDDVLKSFGFLAAERAELKASGVIG